jgi:hypothetical protein
VGGTSSPPAETNPDPAAISRTPVRSLSYAIAPLRYLRHALSFFCSQSLKAFFSPMTHFGRDFKDGFELGLVLVDVSAQMSDDLLQTTLHLLGVMARVAVVLTRHEAVPCEA